MSTKKLARHLGLVRQRSGSSAGPGTPPVAAQIFSYLIVIDFESTCWKDKSDLRQEIIEFPAVLLNTSTGEIQSEFHAYVQPQEHPVLSRFCTELTGITQAQVEAAAPLGVCLSQFRRWLRTLQSQKGLVFPCRRQENPAASPPQTLCTFLTWSDWDLGVCLLYECKRKQILKPEEMSSWIDLRSTYRLFYDRKPRGLNGALQDLGIQFSGREHSGLDDSRNTARLAARMMKDGCVMKITRSPEGAPPASGGTWRRRRAPQEGRTAPAREPASSSERQGEPPGNSAGVSRPEENLSSAPGSAPACRSLVSPRTLLAGTTSPPWSSGGMKTLGAAGPPGNIWPPSLGGLSPSCPSHLPQQLQAAGAPAEEELGVELEDRGGSFDVMVLEVEDVTMETGRTSAWEEGARIRVSPMGSGAACGRRSDPAGADVCARARPGGPTRRDASFKAPPPANRTSAPTPCGTWTRPSARVRGADAARPVRTKTLDRETWSSSAGPPRKHTQTSFSDAPLPGAVLSSEAVKVKVGKITSPLCVCGRRSKRLLVSNGGPNQGRAFFCCAGRRSAAGCAFFRWEAAVARRTWAGPGGVLPEASLCRDPDRPRRKSCEDQHLLRTQLHHSFTA